MRTLGADAIAGADSMPATEVGDRLIDKIELIQADKLLGASYGHTNPENTIVARSP